MTPLVDTLNERALPAGFTFALPTEAQWEYAARAGSEETWPSGATPDRLGDFAWSGENDESAMSHPVGGRRPNA